MGDNQGRAASQGGARRTEVVLGAMFELFVRHQLLNLASHSLHVVDDQFIQIGVLVFGVHDELRAHCLACWVGIRLDDIYTINEYSDVQYNSTQTYRCAGTACRPPSKSQQDDRYPSTTAG